MTLLLDLFRRRVTPRAVQRDDRWRLGTLAILAFVAVGALPLVIGAVMAGQWIVLLAGFGGAVAFTFVLTARR